VRLRNAHLGLGWVGLWRAILRLARRPLLDQLGRLRDTKPSISGTQVLHRQGLLLLGGLLLLQQLLLVLLDLLSLLL
jgi:hypothetical protein